MKEEVKNKILRMLVADSRVQIGVTDKNNTPFNNAILPVDIKRKIDEIYNNIEQIAADNHIATQAVVGVIENKKCKITEINEKLYIQKSDKQSEKMKNFLDNASEKIEKTKEDIKDEMKDERTNTAISEYVSKEVGISVHKIAQVINNELLLRGGSPKEIETKLTRVSMEIQNCIRKSNVKQDLIDELNLDDAKVANRINQEIDKSLGIVKDEEKSAHQKFAESIKTEDPAMSLPDDIFAEQKEKKEEKTEKEYGTLDSDVIR